MGKITKIAIVGLPNTGKSQIFNNLTGEYTTVANYSGTTIEMKRSLARINGRDYEVIDTPGLHCLYIHSEEELAVRDMLFTEKPDIVLQCVDAKFYRQSLMLTAELFDIGIPMVIALNSVNEAARKGVWVDAAELEKTLGVPVIEFMAMYGLGADELKNAITKARKGKKPVDYGTVIENDLKDVAAVLPGGTGFEREMGALLLFNDPPLEAYIEKHHGREQALKIKEEVNRIRRRTKYDIRRRINGRRGEWVEETCRTAVKKQKLTPESFSAKFTQASRNPITGVPILLGFMVIAFFLVVNVSLGLEKALNAIVVKPVVGRIEAFSIPLFWKDLLVGPHGLLTLGIFNAICTVLPILSVFFLLFGFVEDSGYFANFCVLTRRVFATIGVSGKSVTSFILAFACKTMATLNARALSNGKEKFITVFIIAFAIPCSAQMGISMVILAKVGIWACVIAFGALGIFSLGAGLVLNAVIRDEEPDSFIEVLPNMCFPNMRAVLRKTYFRVVEFLKEAVPLFLIAALTLFAFERTGVLEIIKKLMEPVIVGWMGLPNDMLDVFMLALASRAAGAGLIFKMVDSGGLDFIQSIVAVAVTASFFPCFPNLMAIAREMGPKRAAGIAALSSASAFILVGLLHWILVLAMK
jgi:ferrous iron transport protein B